MPMFRLITLLTFLLFQISLTAQLEIVKFHIGDTFESDETYQYFKNRELETIAEINVLRDSIFFTKRLNYEEKLYAIQLINNLYDNPINIRKLLEVLDDSFAWFMFLPRERIEELVNDFLMSLSYCRFIRIMYGGKRSKVHLKELMNTPDFLKKALELLNLHKSKAPASIYFNNMTGNFKIDKRLRNKDIYFRDFIRIRPSWSWRQQIYAFKRNSNRNNNYFCIEPNPEVQSKEVFLDYIIDGPTIRLHNNHDFLNMLKHGGIYYVELMFLTEQEYKEHLKDLSPEFIENELLHGPHFTKELFEEFLINNDLTIEREEKNNASKKYKASIRYVLRKN